MTAWKGTAWQRSRKGCDRPVAHSPRSASAQRCRARRDLQADHRAAPARRPAVLRAIGKASGCRRQRSAARAAPQADGVVQIVAVTDPLTLGFTRQAMIAVKCDGDLARYRRARRYRGDRLRRPHRGSFDLLCEVVCEDDDHLLNPEPRAQRAVRDIHETFVYLKLRKQTYSWGTR